MTSKEIARHLRNEPKTVDNLVQRLQKRWAAKNRAHAVALGFRKGLLK